MAFVNSLALHHSFSRSSWAGCLHPQRSLKRISPRPWQDGEHCGLTMAIAHPLKSTLLDAIRPLNLGRAIAKNPNAQAEIESLIQNVEAANPSSNVAADPNLSGNWRLLYTTSASVLRANSPTILQSVEIFQLIDATNLKAKNVEYFQLGPLKFTNAVEAKLVPLSDRKFEVNFTQFIVLGIFKFNVESKVRFKGSLETTYLDEKLRISRGDKGNVFVLMK